MNQSLRGEIRDIATKIISVVLATMLCVWALPTYTANAQPSALADSSEQISIAATKNTCSLTIAFGQDTSSGDPILALNQNYALPAGATMQDLLDTAVANQDIMDYELNSYGFIDSITNASGLKLQGAAGFSNYWSFFIDGAYYSGLDTLTTLVLEAGKKYQLAWDDYPVSTAPDWSQVPEPQPVAGEDPPQNEDDDGDSGEDGSDNEDDGDDSANEGQDRDDSKNQYNRQTFEQLYTNIINSYANTSLDWQAMELAAAGRTELINRETIVKQALSVGISPGTGDIQRSILAVTALNLDATALLNEQSGEQINLIEQLGSAQIAHTVPNAKMFSLLAYASGPYTPSAEAIANTSELCQSLIDEQHADGSWSYTGTSPDADMTAMGITALAPYRSDPAVEAAIQKALLALESMQLPNGGFSSMYAPTATDVSSTAMVIIAYAALGIDAQDQIAALLTLASDDQSGFTYGGVYNDMATEHGLRALVAYQGYLNTQGAYNIYTQAALGQANLPNSSAPTDDDTNASGTANEANLLPKTADSLQIALCVMLLLALASGFCFTGLILNRRRHQSSDRR